MSLLVTEPVQSTNSLLLPLGSLFAAFTETQLLLIRIDFFQTVAFSVAVTFLFHFTGRFLIVVSVDVSCFRIAGTQAALQQDARREWKGK